VLGLDVSGDQINVAKKRMQKSGLDNLEFAHANATDLAANISEKFDYAIIIFVIHEIDYSERIQLLKQVADIADKLVILDYHYPMSRNIPGYIIRLTELLAGKNHFANFRDYTRRGGIIPLLSNADLTILNDRINRPGVFRTIVATKDAKF
jgi:ubiquinone/menaquinone biosynthesis C-methylase UbiE